MYSRESLQSNRQHYCSVRLSLKFCWEFGGRLLSSLLLLVMKMLVFSEINNSYSVTIGHLLEKLSALKRRNVILEPENRDRKMHYSFCKKYKTDINTFIDLYHFL